MASEVVEKIKAAEQRAENIISDSKVQAKNLLAEADDLAKKQRADFEQSLKTEARSMTAQAEKQADDILAAGRICAVQECDKLSASLQSKKAQAVDLIIAEILK